MPSTLPVTSPLDDVSQRGTLRWAVAHADNGDTIRLTGPVALTGITLTQGELILNQRDLTITTAGQKLVAVSGGGLSRVFEVASGASVTLSDLTITRGNGLTGNPIDSYEGRGGGIVVDVGATLTITDSTVTGNSVKFVTLPTGGSVGGLGGGIADYGTLTVKGCTVSDNQAQGTFGGGIAVFSGTGFSTPFSATLTVTDSTLSNNTAHFDGGAIGAASSTVTLANCVVTGNVASFVDGGGLNNHGGILTVSHSRVADNAAPNGNGGGIYNYTSSTLTVIDSDLGGNVAGWYGGGVASVGKVFLNSSRLSDNTAYDGAALFNGYTGTMTIGASKINWNSAIDAGGGISNYGILDISGGEICNNSADQDYFPIGGGIDNEDGVLTIRDCLLSGNVAGGAGGAIFSWTLATITDCTLSDNTAREAGGAIENDGVMTIDHCTLSGNAAEFGGGIANFGSVAVNNSTFIDDSPDNIYGNWSGSGNTGL